MGSQIFDDASEFLDGPPKDIHGWTQPLRTVSRSASIPRAAMVPPFWQYKPPEGVDLSATRRGTLAAGVGSTLTLTPVRPWFIIPSYEGVLSSLVVGVLAPTALLNITFTLLNRNGPVQGWDNIVPPNTAANAILLPFNGPLQLPESSLLTVLVTNNSAAGPWDVEATLSGWMWPRIARLETFGEAG